MEPTLGEIRLFAGNFAPRGWAFCQGQLLAVSQHSALFSILGTTYGGDGRTTFALPDLRGRVPLAPGTGPGLSAYRVGETAGFEQVTLNAAEMPQHDHTAHPSLQYAQPASTAAADTPTPGPSARPSQLSLPGYGHSPADTTLTGAAVTGSVTLGRTGGSQPHENRQPYTALNYIIALEGIYPSRG